MYIIFVTKLFFIKDSFQKKETRNMTVFNRFPALALAAVLLAGALSACTIIRELPSTPTDTELSRELAEERDFSRKLLEAFLKNDEKAFIAPLKSEMQEDFRKDKTAFSRFRKIILEERGEPVSFSYLTPLESVVITPHIWKVRFRHKNKENKEFYREALFRVLVGHVLPEDETSASGNPTSPGTEGTPSDEESGLIIYGFNFL